MAPEIVLRPWDRRRDRGELARWPAPTDPHHWLWAYNPRRPEAGRRSWAILQAGGLVGRITVGGYVPPHTLGIYLRPDALGRGIGSAALPLFLDLAFHVHNLASIRLVVAAANERAVKLYRRAGFIPEWGTWEPLPAGGALPAHVLVNRDLRLAFYWRMLLTARVWDASCHAFGSSAAGGAGAGYVSRPAEG